MTIVRDDSHPASGPDLRSLVAKVPLFEGLQDEALRAVEAKLEWLSLPGGWTLFRQGEEADALYVVTSGRLGVFVEGDGGSTTLVGEVTAGEVAGEMALITGQPRSATVMGLRDTTLLRFSQAAFDDLVEKHPRAMFQLTRLIVRRLEKAIHQRAQAPAPKTFALLPLGADVPAAEVSACLTEALGRIGFKAHLLTAEAGRHSTEWFHNVEEANDAVVYQADPSLSPWTRLCLRQADCILLTARSWGDPSRRFEVEEALGAEGARKWATQQELVLLHESGTVHPAGTARWLEGRNVAMHHHVRLGRAADFDRLARLLTGRAVGLVLSGGAARGCAHLGVVRALREAGVPIDLVGGVSMGALVAAVVAQELDYEKMLSMYRRGFVETNPLGDYTLPIVALVAGRRVSRLLRKNFGGGRIEDFWLSFFCVSSNLTTGLAAVHTSGPSWRWMRASVALPGILPPVIEKGEVFVDGGVVNNLPVDVMRGLGRGPVIGVDVGSDAPLSASGSDPESIPFWQLLANSLKRRNVQPLAPNILHILWRAGTVNSSAAAAVVREQVDLLLQPPLASVDMLDWKAVDRVVEIGYRDALAQLAKLRESGEMPRLFFSG